MQTRLANTIKTQPLFEEEIGVIVGCLLGDGTLSKSGKHYRLRVEHTKRHSEYVDWKYSLLRRITITPPSYLKSHESLRFGTVGHPDITKIKEDWYRSGRKIVPSTFTHIDPRSIAIWFMDDGTKHRDTVDISVHNYCRTEINRLRSLLSQYGLETTINTDGKGYRLYVLKKSYPAFKALVKPYIVKCMAYKLP